MMHMRFHHMCIIYDLYKQRFVMHIYCNANIIIRIFEIKYELKIFGSYI